jgi:hypothetical protein
MTAIRRAPAIRFVRRRQRLAGFALAIGGDDARRVIRYLI